MIAVGPIGGPLSVKSTLNQQADGTYTISNLDGTVMSVNPQGNEEVRPAGTTGPWERAARVGNVLVFWSGDLNAKVYLYSIADKVPNW